MMRLLVGCTLLCLLGSFQSWGAEEVDSPVAAKSELPAASTSAEATREAPLENPVVPSIVHNPQHTLDKRYLIQVGPALLSGDRYLSTMGVAVQGHYFFGEQWGVSAAFMKLSSSASQNAQSLNARLNTPLAHNPDQILQLTGVFVPFYGKFALGEHIQRFYWSVEAGGHLARERTSDEVQTAVVESRNVFGPSIGTALLFPVSNRFSLSARFQALFHGSLLEGESGGRRNLIYGLQLGYLL